MFFFQSKAANNGSAADGTHLAGKEEILGSDVILLGRTTCEIYAPYWSSLKNNEYEIADKLNSVSKYAVSSTLKKAEWYNSTIHSILR